MWSAVEARRPDDGVSHHQRPRGNAGNRHRDLYLNVARSVPKSWHTEAKDDSGLQQRRIDTMIVLGGLLVFFCICALVVAGAEFMNSHGN
jgi:hypothetical protein